MNQKLDTIQLIKLKYLYNYYNNDKRDKETINKTKVTKTSLIFRKNIQISLCFTKKLNKTEFSKIVKTSQSYSSSNPTLKQNKINKKTEKN